MELPIYQIDAFTNRAFAGNPAAVMPLDSWLPDQKMQQIATENNLAETVFFVPEGDRYHIRWFTPTVEVKLCGHATLASAYVISNFLESGRDDMIFDSLSGELRVKRDGDRFTLNFPAISATPANEILEGIAGCFNRRPSAVCRNDSFFAHLAVFDHAIDIREIVPSFAALTNLGKDVIVTAPADGPDDSDIDFVSRFFGPNVGIPEDPVTGSAHCMLTYYWSNRLGKTHLRAKQVSPRGGDLWLELKGDRVLISGQGVCVMKGTMTV